MAVQVLLAILFPLSCNSMAHLNDKQGDNSIATNECILHDMRLNGIWSLSQGDNVLDAFVQQTKPVSAILVDKLSHMFARQICVLPER